MANTPILTNGYATSPVCTGQATNDGLTTEEELSTLYYDATSVDTIHMERLSIGSGVATNGGQSAEATALDSSSVTVSSDEMDGGGNGGGVGDAGPTSLSSPCNEVVLYPSLQSRLEEIFSCIICRLSPKIAMYQCQKGHLLCAPCLSHLFTEGRLNKTRVRCPKCDVILSCSTVSRNRAVEIAAAELPDSCRNTSIQCSITVDFTEYGGQ